MWGEAKQHRLEQLSVAAERGVLSASDDAELQSLRDERIHEDDQALRRSTRRMERENAATAARVEEAAKRNRELEGLVREQEAYLAHAERRPRSA